MRFVLLLILILSVQNSNCQNSLSVFSGINFPQLREFKYNLPLRRSGETSFPNLPTKMKQGWIMGSRGEHKGRLLSWQLDILIHRLSYEFIYPVPQSQMHLLTEISSYSWNLRPSVNKYIFKEKFSIGLGIELAYFTKPRIQTSYPVRINIWDLERLSKGVNFNTAWHIKAGEHKFSLRYDYSRFVGQEPLLIDMWFQYDGQNYLIGHEPKFNCHQLTLSYVLFKDEE